MQLFYNISEMLTLEGVEQKKGRYIQEKDLGVVKRAAILEDDGKIISCGDEQNVISQVPKGQKINKIDCDKLVVLPGLIDCHTHLVFAGQRFHEFEKRIAGASYLDIAKSGGGIVSTVEATRKASKEDLEKRGKKYLSGIIRHGTALMEAKSGYGLSLESELKILEVLNTIKENSPIDIITTFLGAHAFAPEFKEREEDYVKELIEKALPLVKERNLARFCDVFCDKGFFSNEQCFRISKAAQKLGLKLSLHVDELEDTGGTALAVELNAASASHLLRTNKENIKKLAKSETVGIMLPGTPFFLREKHYAPARELLDEGAVLAVASDFNPGSNMCYNLPLTATMAALLLEMTIPEVISGITFSAAKALNIEHRAGTITPGKDCHLSMFKTTCYQEIFCHYGENHCAKVYFAGKQVF